MSNYLKHIQSTANSKTFSRRVAYLSYNFSFYLNQLSKSSRVLEVGPGKGELLSILNQKNIKNLDIIDNDQAVLDYCQKTYQLKQTTLLKTDQSIKYLKNKYDLIILTQVFEHINKDSYLVWLRGLYKALKPGGHILITVPNGANPLSGTERYGDLQHQNIFTIYSLNELITFANLKNASHKIIGFNIPLTNPINLVRIVLQKILHSIFILLMIINGAIYQTLMAPNITLVIKKNK
jgi:2-polyprenyl-3-methyl-5-hydroxy-6-metoxy-1,4-benzoquinol methylase